jgi:hypothetical protein
MKRLTFIILALLVAFAMPVLAQNKTKKVEDRIQLAREKYAEGLELVAADEEGFGGSTTIVRAQMWAAVGPRIDTMRFYYNELREHEEEPYPDGYALRMVRHFYNVTVRNHYSEYIFDDKGKPLFYFTRFTELLDDEECGFHLYGNAEDGLPQFEVRHYYDEHGKVIRSIYKMLDENGQMKQMTESQAKTLESLTTYELDFDYVKGVFESIYNNKKP